MTGRLLGISAGAPGGSAEIALKVALRAAEAEGADIEMVRLDELNLPSAPRDGDADDVWWLWDRMLEADGLIASTPIYCRSLPARLKIVMDRLLGPNADRAIVEKMLALRAAGEQPAVPFRLDERVLRNRVAGFIAVGGSLTPQWKTLVMPEMHALTLSMQTAVVDQLVIAGTGTPKSVVLDDHALSRAAELGTNVAKQLGRPFDEAEYVGEPGLCPMCNLSVVELRGQDVICATCGAQGVLAANGHIDWTDLSTSVISMEEKRAHYEEIVETAEQHAMQRDIIAERAAAYNDYEPVVRPSDAEGRDDDTVRVP